jgi:carboxylate-amine ligase
MKDFYWDIRPKPEYGTIELRVCDTPLTVELAAALAAYLQVLCALLQEGGEPEPEETDYLVYNYNRFQACRFGLDGTVVHPRSYASTGLREDIEATLARVRPIAADLQAGQALDHLRHVLRQDNDACFLRRRRDEAGSVEGVVDAALRRFRD